MSNLIKIPRSKLPRDICFTENGNTLYMKMSQDCVTTNMQENPAAFETWALYARVAGYERVELSESKEWTGEMTPAKRQHYHRFLYRVLRFNEAFDWFVILSPLKEKVKEFEKTYLSGNDLFVNAPITLAKAETDSPEARVERLLVDKNCGLLNEKFNLKISEYYHQLPVGLFKGRIKSDTAIFPRSHAAIDIWALDGNTFHLFELKVGKNQDLGVLSEVFFYACYIRDMYGIKRLGCNKDLAYEKQYSGNLGFKGRGYSKLINENIDSVVIHILTEKMHGQLIPAFNELKKHKLSGICFEDVKSYLPSELLGDAE